MEMIIDDNCDELNLILDYEMLNLTVSWLQMRIN